MRIEAQRIGGTRWLRAHQLVSPCGRVGRRLGARTHPAQQHGLQRRLLERLAEVIIHASRQAFLTITQQGIGCQGNDGHACCLLAGRLTLANGVRGFIAILVRHLAIHEDDIEMIMCTEVDGLLTMLGQTHLTAHAGQYGRGHFLVHLVVFGQQHAHPGQRFGQPELRLHGTRLADAAQGIEQQLLAQRFVEMGIAAGATYLGQITTKVGGGQHHHRQLGWTQVRADATQQFDAVHERHADIQQCGIEGLVQRLRRLQQRQRLTAGRHIAGQHAPFLGVAPQDVGIGRIIIDHQHAQPLEIIAEIGGGQRLLGHWQRHTEQEVAALAGHTAHRQAAPHQLGQLA